MFHFRLEGPSPSYAGSGSGVELESVDDYQYLTVEGCALLAETDCSFKIGGFGEEDWGFDISYDMSSLIEELPELISELEAGRTISVDLYPQGVERTLTFRSHDGLVEIACASRTSWKPEPQTETVSRADLLVMVRQLAVDFATALSIVAPEIARLAPFSSWQVGINF